MTYAPTVALAASATTLCSARLLRICRSDFLGRHTDPDEGKQEAVAIVRTCMTVPYPLSPVLSHHHRHRRVATLSRDLLCAHCITIVPLSSTDLYRSRVLSVSMSVSPSDFPSARPVAVEDSSLPQGQCRYILLIPGVKGQRCGCAHFSLTQAKPGAGCDCGHMACYHVQDSDTTDRHELDLLRQRVHALEQQLKQTRQPSHVAVIARVSELEETLDRKWTETGQEMKGSYRNVTRVWQSVNQLEQRHQRLYEAFQAQARHLALLGRDLKDMGNRQLELFDADISLEERLDRIEGIEVGRPLNENDTLPPASDETLETTPESLQLSGPGGPGTGPRVPSEPAVSNLRLHGPQLPSLALSSIQNLVLPESSAGQRPRRAWTVHISLLPTSSQPFPFERDTEAYKRCLSRGLHQTVVVADSSGTAFDEAVERSFRHILRGRAWMPLKAKLCDLSQLKGLPMLRKLDSSLMGGPYDTNFLLEHCAVCDSRGHIESLYLAMQHDTLSWPFLRTCPVFIDGLEACWEYDQYLEPSDHFAELGERSSVSSHPAVDVRPGLSSIKRTAVEDYEENLEHAGKLRRIRHSGMKRGIRTM